MRIPIVGNYGHEWEVGEVEITSPYKPASAEEIQGKIGLHISLRGINVTLKGLNLRTLIPFIPIEPKRFSFLYRRKT
jgi:hypothetical protein